MNTHAILPSRPLDGSFDNDLLNLYTTFSLLPHVNVVMPIQSLLNCQQQTQHR